MANDVKVPSVGESVTEGMIANWHVSDGDVVALDDVLVDLETDKATVEIISESAGTIKIIKKAGETVKVGEVIANIEPSGAAVATKPKAAAEEKTKAAMTPPPAPPASSATAKREYESSPAVRRSSEELGVDVNTLSGSGRDGRVIKGDVLAAAGSAKPSSGQSAAQTAVPPSSSKPAAAASKAIAMPNVTNAGRDRSEWREPMTMMRRRIAERLIASQETAAILTTFNEIDMTAVKNLRAQYKDKFKEKHGINLGFMSFFVKAACVALKKFPRINGWIDGNDIVYHNYCDVGVAVSTEKGLMVPVIRDADLMNFAQIEAAIAHYAEKARLGKIALDDLSGGTFTVSNGGIFGSLMSTPILNPPQSGILGMHKIQDRPMAIDGEVKIRPMMYVAMSYDHRIVDGSEAVGSLVTIKECLEDPARMLFDL